MMDYIPCPVCEGHGYTNWTDYDAAVAKTCEYCSGRGYMPAPKTNADRIRSMKDEELAVVIACPHNPLECVHPGENCVSCCLEWLKEKS